MRAYFKLIPLIFLLKNIDLIRLSLTRQIFNIRCKKATLGNSDHFCLFSQICEIFRKFKKEICSRIVGSNFSRHCGSQKLQQWTQNLKIRVFRTSYFDQFMNSRKHAFCDSAYCWSFLPPQCHEKLEPTIFEHISFLNSRKISQIREKRQKWSEFPKVAFLHRMLKIFRVNIGLRKKIRGVKHDWKNILPINSLGWGETHLFPPSIPIYSPNLTTWITFLNI